MTAIVTSTDIDRSAESVFDYATDPTHFHEWQSGVISGQIEGGKTPTVGAHCTTTRRIGLANRPSTSELVHIDPPKTWSVHGIDEPIRATVDVAVQALNDTRSNLTISVDFEGHGIGRVLVPLVVRRQARKEMPTNLTALKAHLEQGEPTSA